MLYLRDLDGGAAGLKPCGTQVVTSKGSMNRAATEIFCRGVIYHAHGPINWAATKRTGRTLQKGYVLGFRAILQVTCQKINVKLYRVLPKNP